MPRLESESQLAVLQIGINGGWSVAELATVLNDLDYAYQRLVAAIYPPVNYSHEQSPNDFPPGIPWFFDGWFDCTDYGTPTLSR
jgi:hypothetical protein